MINGSLNEEGISPSMANHENYMQLVSVLKQSTSLVSHLFSSLQSRPNADIDDLCYLRIKRSHHHYLTKGNGGVGKSRTS